MNQTMASSSGNTRHNRRLRRSRNLRTQGNRSWDNYDDGLSRASRREAARLSSSIQSSFMAPLARKGCCSAAPLTGNVISTVASGGSTVASGGSLEKSTEHSGGTDRGFERLFLYHQSLPRLEISTHQLVSLIVSIWYIYIYIAYVWCRLQKSCISRDKLWKLLV